MNKSRHVTRRNALQLGAAATALPLVHIRTAGAAGKLTVGFWDHWVPPANDAMKKQVIAWAEKNKVDVTDRLHHLEWQQDRRSPRPPKRRPGPATTSCRSTTGR